MSSYLEILRKAKEALVVAKTEFATFASGVPSDHSILVFEGADDKIAYAHWLRILKPNFKYESLIRGNKAGALRLFDALAKDEVGLARKVFYFVDRDFDDLQGREQSQVIFMTDRYSIENYCVGNEVLDELLKDIFHCNGIHQTREFVAHEFSRLYAEFLRLTKEINFRIFISRRLKIIDDQKLPSRINQFAIVDLQSVRLAEAALPILVPLIREPTDDEVQAHRPEFEEMDASARYRGKFALLFFARWLALLRTDRQSEDAKLFQGIPKPELNVRGDFTFEVLLPRVPPPPSMHQFVAQMN